MTVNNFVDDVIRFRSQNPLPILQKILFGESQRTQDLSKASTNPPEKSDVNAAPAAAEMIEQPLHRKVVDVRYNSATTSVVSKRPSRPTTPQVHAPVVNV